jgi:hypothetical protein
MKLMKATLRRLWRLTRATSIVVGLAVMVGLVAGVASLAVAGPSSGGSTATAVLKGVTNTANAVTTLVNSGTGAALRLEAQSGNPALSLPAQTGTAPLAVNSETKVNHLNADKLDDKESTDFLAAHGTADNAANADKLDGKDSTDFTPKTYIVEETITVNPGIVLFWPVICDSGDLALRGGWRGLNRTSFVKDSHGTFKTLGVGDSYWQVAVQNDGDLPMRCTFRRRARTSEHRTSSNSTVLARAGAAKSPGPFSCPYAPKCLERLSGN